MSATAPASLPGPGDGSFPAGTPIAVPGGAEIAVERLARGDLVATAAGPVALRHVGEIITAPAEAAPRLLPVLVAAGAAGAGLPRQDLLMPPQQLLHVQDASLPGGALAALGALVNGTTIRRTAPPGPVTWYRLELEAPGIIQAAGLPVAARHDPTAPPPAAILPPGPAIAALRNRLSAMSAETAPPASAPLPAPDMDPPPNTAAPNLTSPDDTASEDTEPGYSGPGYSGPDHSAPDPNAPLNVLANDRILPPDAASTATHWHFTLPAGADEVVLLSPPGVPATMPANQRQRARRYGVALRAIHLDDAALPLAKLRNDQGFHDHEVSGNQSWRWTDGRAHIPVAPAPTPRRLIVEITDWHTLLDRD